jgi:hypothetical protein
MAPADISAGDHDGTNQNRRCPESDPNNVSGVLPVRGRREHHKQKHPKNVELEKVDGLSGRLAPTVEGYDEISCAIQIQQSE